MQYHSILKLGIDTDFSKYEMKNSREIMSVISYYRNDWDVLKKIVFSYSNGIYFTDDMMQKYHTIKIWEDSEFENMVKTLLLTNHAFK